MSLEQATPNRLFSRSAGHGTRPGVIHRAEPGKSLKLFSLHWNWDEHQRQETLVKNDIKITSPKQTVQSKQLPEPGVVSALSDEDDSGNEHDGNQINFDATVRPVTLSEGWTFVLNSLRQVVYCHVKSVLHVSRCPRIPSCWTI